MFSYAIQNIFIHNSKIKQSSLIHLFKGAFIAIDLVRAISNKKDIGEPVSEFCFPRSDSPAH